MNLKKLLAASLGLCGLLLNTACVNKPTYDYTNFRQSRPISILILPPVNESTSVEASYSLWSQMSLPLGESGYYVYPLALVNETFHQNGITNPNDAAAIPIEKLHEIFGADAALYVNIKKYGTTYRIINSATEVSAEARLVDLRNGSLLWQGTAFASSAEQHSANSGGLIGMLVIAVVNQIVEQSTDTGHKIAAIAGTRLVAAGRPAGMLYGPRSPHYQEQQN